MGRAKIIAPKTAALAFTGATDLNFKNGDIGAEFGVLSGGTGFRKIEAGEGNDRGEKKTGECGAIFHRAGCNGRTHRAESPSGEVLNSMPGRLCGVVSQARPEGGRGSEAKLQDERTPASLPS